MTRGRTKEAQDAFIQKLLHPEAAPVEADIPQPDPAPQEDEEGTDYDLTFEQMSVDQLNAVLAWNEGDAQMTLDFLAEFRPYVEARRRGEPVRWQE
ncbi:hypothetical protein [Shinella sp. DD12]|uniref:hypothetical protein n=1 Tax=Shinella sp. DD12 TaxID=1410620 RepID=UPI0003C53891|nr:hypothetical protein [Shinella sp. DD12]EYR81852.1 hypothetical protein SHLA_4c001440 [Shinella sp. DD12]